MQLLNILDLEKNYNYKRNTENYFDKTKKSQIEENI